jgi:hypothetical protein
MRHEGAVLTARFSPNGNFVVTASADGTARLWQAATGQYFGMLLLHRGPVNTACFSPDGSSIVTASNDGTARLWAIPRLEAGQAATLADLAEATGRLMIGDWGTLLPLPDRDRLIARLQAKATAQNRATKSDFDRVLQELAAPLRDQGSEPRSFDAQEATTAIR